MSTSGLSSAAGGSAFFCFLEEGSSPVGTPLPWSLVVLWMPFTRGGEGDLSRALRRGGSGCTAPFAFVAEAFTMF